MNHGKSCCIVIGLEFKTVLKPCFSGKRAPPRIYRVHARAGTHAHWSNYLEEWGRFSRLLLHCLESLGERQWPSPLNASFRLRELGILRAGPLKETSWASGETLLGSSQNISCSRQEIAHKNSFNKILPEASATLQRFVLLMII